MNHLAGLNEKQKEAVETTEGPLLILAGAGAGKTKTLTHRMLHLIKQGVAPHEILAITFTNKAANEMRERVVALIESDSELNITVSFRERPFVKTFHSLGVHMLREQHDTLGLSRNFSICDWTDSAKIIKDAMKAEDIDPKEHEPKKILGIISKHKGDMVSFKEYEAQAHSDYMSEIVVRLWRRYEQALRDSKSLDFDDLLLKTALLLKEHKHIREHYQHLWKYIHIDEYQDTNEVQYQIALMLAGGHNNLCVVGDIDQNIYSWRGATIKNILHFEKDFPDATVIFLEENYRSTQTILSAANEVIKKNVNRREKNLFTSNGDGDPIMLYNGFDEHDEARYIVEEVNALIRSGIEPQEIALLYRANFQSRILEEWFLREGIPYQVLGTRFFDRREVKDVLAYMKAAMNPDDLASLGRIVNVPTRGIGKVTYLKMCEGREGDLAGKARESVARFRALLHNINKEITTRPPHEVVTYILKHSGLEDSFKKDGDEGMERMHNVLELANLASKYTDMEPVDATLKLLEDASLATDQDSLEEKEKKNAVKMMTVHASKGLEFDYVFITGLEEGLFPHEGFGEVRDEEEERRLFYVALTRARKKVFLTYAGIRTIFGSQRVNIPSQFIDDIPKDHIETPDGGYDDDPVASDIRNIFIDF